MQASMGQQFDSLSRKEQKALKQAVTFGLDQYVEEKSASSPNYQKPRRAEKKDMISSICEKLAGDKGFVARAMERGGFNKGR